MGVAYPVNKFGNNPDIDSGTQEDVWDGGGSYPWQDTAQSLEILSSGTGSGNDTAAGTGARTVEIQGLDGDYNRQTETVTMNGTTPVTLANTYLRVFRMKVFTAGTGGANDATLICRVASGGDTQAQIQPEKNQTLMALYTIPANFQGKMFNYYASVARAQATALNIELYVRPPGETFQLKHKIGGQSDGNTLVQHNFEPYFTIPEKSDIVLRADVGANNTEVNGGFDMQIF